MTYDLTVGKTGKTLFKYTVPMFISVVFQQLYNIADSAIVGKFAGESALAAVGASYAITMIFMAICTGSNIGCTVVLSQCFGAKKLRDFKTGAFTALIFGVVLSSFLTLLAVVFSPLMLKAINTPGVIFSNAKVYLMIYLAGFIFLFMYNMINGVFNAMGDSKTPLYFLIFSSLGNVALDLLFVVVFDAGVAGAAIATLIAQGVACIGAFFVLLNRLFKIKTEHKPERFSFHMLGTILFIAIPSILQSSFVSVGNLLIQGLVNSCGESVIAGFSAAFKLNAFFITSITMIGNSVSAFTAQNIGAAKNDRVVKGFGSGMVMGLIFCIPFTVAYLVFGKPILMLFMESEGSSALAVGMEFLTYVAPFYALITIKLICDGVLKGTKSMLFFMISTFSDLIVRVIVSFAFFDSMKELAIFSSWPTGWIVGTLLSFMFCVVLWMKIKRSMTKSV